MAGLLGRSYAQPAQQSPNDYLTQTIASGLGYLPGYQGDERAAYQQAKKFTGLLDYTPAGIPQAAYSAGGLLGQGARAGSAAEMGAGALATAMAVAPAPSRKTLAAIQAAMDKAGINHAISEGSGIINLSKIVVPKDKRGQGIGSDAMKALAEYADESGQKIALSPSADFGGNKSRLKEFYSRFGFQENKGRARDFTTRETMLRDPKGKP